MWRYDACLGKVLYLTLSGFSHQLPKCCIFGILKHVHSNVWQLTVRFLENRINRSLIGMCIRLMHIRIIIKVKRRFSVWNEEWESYGIMSRIFVSNFLLCCQSLDVVELMFLLELRVVFLSLYGDYVALIDLEVISL